MTDCSALASKVLAWVPVLSALLTPVIGIITVVIGFITVYIARQQWLTNRNKLKLDLFDRRFAVYAAARDLVRDVLAQTHPSDDQLLAFRANTGEASFLLNQSIAKYLTDELCERASELNRLRSGMVNLPDAERTSRQARQDEIHVWFDSQLKVLEGKFAEFLDLTH